jgi:hypothetical protein
MTSQQQLLNLTQSSHQQKRISFRTDNLSVDSREFKQLKVNRKEKIGSEKKTSLSFLISNDIKTVVCHYTRL